MIDCGSYTGPYGMGWVSDVHKGLTSNRTYPLANHSDPTLKGCRSTCNMSAADPARSVAHISGATCLGKPVYDNESQMLAWLQHGPLSVSVDASFGGYTGGVLSGAGCNHTRVDHAVLLVGYGVDTSTVPWLPYWKVRNSWGPAFGEGGYVRIQAGVKCLGLRGACQAYIGQPPSHAPSRGAPARPTRATRPPPTARPLPAVDAVARKAPAVSEADASDLVDLVEKEAATCEGCDVFTGGAGVRGPAAAGASSAPRLPRTAHLGTVLTHAPPRSRAATRILGGGKGGNHSIPAGGAVWPTAIYWALVQVGTPARSYPAAIDSGSGDLDVGAKGCAGCATAAPNRPYDHAASSTSRAAYPFTFSNTYETCDLKHPTAPCTVSGRLYKDQVSLAGFGPVEVRLGAIEKQDANFGQFQQADEP